MSNKEILLLFKSTYSINGTTWKQICHRYAARNYSSVLKYIKDTCEIYGNSLPAGFSDYLKSELQNGFAR